MVVYEKSNFSMGNSKIYIGMHSVMLLAAVLFFPVMVYGVLYSISYEKLTIALVGISIFAAYHVAVHLALAELLDLKNGQDRLIDIEVALKNRVTGGMPGWKRFLSFWFIPFLYPLAIGLLIALYYEVNLIFTTLIAVLVAGLMFGLVCFMVYRPYRLCLGNKSDSS